MELAARVAEREGGYGGGVDGGGVLAGRGGVWVSLVVYFALPFFVLGVFLLLFTFTFRVL